MGQGPSDVESDPLAPEHIAPVVAWLVGSSARATTGRVVEAGNGEISLARGWSPGSVTKLPPVLSPTEAAGLLERVVRSADPPARPRMATLPDP
jgi:hypothetical protein